MPRNREFACSEQGISAAKSRSPPDEVFDQAGIINRARRHRRRAIAIVLNHTIVPTRDKVGPARFFADIFVPFDAQAAISRRFG